MRLWKSTLEVWELSLSFSAEVLSKLAKSFNNAAQITSNVSFGSFSMILVFTEIGETVLTSPSFCFILFHFQEA